MAGSKLFLPNRRHEPLPNYRDAELLRSATGSKSINSLPRAVRRVVDWRRDRRQYPKAGPQAAAMRASRNGADELSIKSVLIHRGTS